MSTLPLHGGGVDDAQQRWPEFRGLWLDLSTGINPWPYPLPDLPTAIWHRLPDQHLDHRLRQAAQQHYGPPSASHILVTPGSGAVIRALPLIQPLGRVAILGPTYGEHAASWGDAGHDVRHCETLAQAGGADVVIVVNPNNPDGRYVSPQALLDFAAASPSCRLVVDQAFGDVDGDFSLIPHLPDNALVLASFGKFFGLAGLRLGFVFGHPRLLAPLAQNLGPWPVSGPALVIGKHALSNQNWIAATRQKLMVHAAGLDDVVRDAGLEIVGGTPLFRLIHCPDACRLWDHLGRLGILTRAFSYRSDWLRLGLPGDQAGLQRLHTGLLSFTPSV